MRLKPWFLLAPVAVTGALIACNLNPQPLPPLGAANEDEGPDQSEGGNFRGDAESQPTNPPPNPPDGGTGVFDGDGGDADSDAGDAGDASDDAETE